MPVYPFPLWKRAPFIRLLPPFIAGIILQWYLHLPVILFWRMAGLSFSGLILYSLFIPYFQFRLKWLTGICIHLLLFGMGALLVHYKESLPLAQKVDSFRSHSNPDTYKKYPEITVAILENPSQKKSSWKTLAYINEIRKKDCVSEQNINPYNRKQHYSPETRGESPGPSPHYKDCCMKNCGKILVYFLKRKRLKQKEFNTSDPALPRYGDIIVFEKPLQPIKNFIPPGPGGFDYRQYCAFAGIHFQVFLQQGEFTILDQKNTNPLQTLLINTRERVITIIKKNIPGKKEQGLAEALLIGYKDDLDKSLLQSYSNTGVVHVIAISGLHLGLIYALLKGLCFPLSRQKKGRWLEPLIILTGLWLFSLLAGGSPSVLRSAVMFSFIVLGKGFSRQTSIYNNLAASAFTLLCYNPFWLWDAGFQLSYAALAGIVIFMKPIYSLITFKSKIADAAWKLNAVTIAAQLLTLPITLFYFHQFPNLFILTNFIAVPLSSVILIGELLLCGFYWFEPVATSAGWMLSWLIRLMNGCIEYLEIIPLSSWKDIYITLPQAVLLYAIIFCGRNVLSKIKR